MPASSDQAADAWRKAFRYSGAPLSRSLYPFFAALSIDSASHPPGQTLFYGNLTRGRMAR